MQHPVNMKQFILIKKLVANILNKIDSRSLKEKGLSLKFMIIQDLVNINQEQHVLLLELLNKRLILTLQLLIVIELLSTTTQDLLIIPTALTSELNIKTIWTPSQFIKETNLGVIKEKCSMLQI